MKATGLTNCCQQDTINQNPSTFDQTSDSKSSTSSNENQSQNQCDFINEKITCIIFSFLLYIIINLKHYLNELVNSVQFVNKNSISSLPRKKQFYRACLNLVPDGLILIGSKGEIQYHNENAKSMLQCEESEILSTIYQLALVDSNGVFNLNGTGQNNGKGQNGTPVIRSSQAVITNNNSFNDSVQKQKNSFYSLHSKIKPQHDLSRQRSLDSKIQQQGKIIKQNTAKFSKQAQYIQSKTLNHSSFRPQPQEVFQMDNQDECIQENNLIYSSEKQQQQQIQQTQPCNITQEILDRSGDQILQNISLIESNIVKPKSSLANNDDSNQQMNCIVINFECDQFNSSPQNPKTKSLKQFESKSFISKSANLIQIQKEENKGSTTQSKKCINLNVEPHDNKSQIFIQKNITQIKQEYIEEIDLNKCKNVQDILDQILNKNINQNKTTLNTTNNLNTNNYVQKSQYQIPTLRKIQDKSACKNRSQTLGDEKQNLHQNGKSHRQKRSLKTNIDYLIQFQTLISNKKVNNIPFQRTSLLDDIEKHQVNEDIVEVKVKFKEKVLLIKLIKLQFETYVDTVKDDKASILIVMKDITKQQLYQELEESNKFQAQMLATVSHELRTPLNCTVMMLQQLKWHISSDLCYQYLKPSLNSCNLLLNLINDILDLAQINAGKFSFSFQKFRLEKLLKETINLLSQKAILKGIEIKLDNDQRIPKHVISDPHRLRQILVNLIGNSLKFTKKGHIILKTQLVSMHPIKMEISVIDTGIGIPKEKQGEIFSTFGKVNDNGSKKLNSNGCGLGLNISNQLAKGIGPNNQGIKLESDVDKGSTFSFCLEDKQVLKKTEDYIGRYKDDLNLQKKNHKRQKNNKSRDNNKNSTQRVSLKQQNPLALNFTSVANMSSSKFQQKDKSLDTQNKKGISNPKPISNIISPQSVTNKMKLSGKNVDQITEEKTYKNGVASNKYEHSNSAKHISSNISIPEIVGEQSPSNGNVSKSFKSKTQSMSKISKSQSELSHSSSSSSNSSSSRSSKIIRQKKDNMKASSALDNNVNGSNNQALYESYSSIRFDKSVLDKNYYHKGSLMSPTHHPKHNLSSLNVGSSSSIQGNRKLSLNNFIPQTPIKIIQTKQVKKLCSKGIPQIFDNRLYLSSLQEKNAKIFLEQNNSELQQDQILPKNKKNMLKVQKHQDSKAYQIKDLDNNSLSQLKEVVNQQQKLIQLKKIEDTPEEDIKSSQQSSLEDINKVYQNENENDQKDEKLQSQTTNNSDIFEKDFNMMNSQKNDKSKIFLKRSHTAEADDKIQRSLIFGLNESINKNHIGKKDALAWFKYYYETLQLKCRCPKILIVDDNQFNVHALRMFIGQYVSAAIDVAFDGEQALEKVLSYFQLSNECGCREYDLIFMDIEMPFLDGFQTSDKIKKFFTEINHNPRAVVVACTAHNELQESKLDKHGIKYYITKPIKRKDLEYVFIQWVNEQQYLLNVQNSYRFIESIQSNINACY